MGHTRTIDLGYRGSRGRAILEFRVNERVAGLFVLLFFTTGGSFQVNVRNLL